MNCFAAACISVHVRLQDAGCNLSLLEGIMQKTFPFSWFYFFFLLTFSGKFCKQTPFSFLPLPPFLEAETQNKEGRKMADMQNDDAFAQAMAITSAQAGVRPMTAQEIVAYAREVAAGIRELQGGVAGAPVGATEPAVNPKDAVRETSVVCLECGAKFKMLTKRHLEQHGLTPAEYKAKWGLKKGTSLACKSIQRMRRQKMQEMQLWTRRKGLEPQAGAE